MVHGVARNIYVNGDSGAQLFGRSLLYLSDFAIFVTCHVTPLLKKKNPYWFLSVIVASFWDQLYQTFLIDSDLTTFK